MPCNRILIKLGQHCSVHENMAGWRDARFRGVIARRRPFSAQITCTCNYLHDVHGTPRYVKIRVRRVDRKGSAPSRPEKCCAEASRVYV